MSLVLYSEVGKLIDMKQNEGEVLTVHVELVQLETNTLVRRVPRKETRGKPARKIVVIGWVK